MLKKIDRLTSEEIETLSEGKSVFGTLISMRYVPARSLKFSVSASKKVFKTAVERNRVRRRVYDAIDMAGFKSAKPASIMLMPKKECVDVNAKSLRAEVNALLARVL